MSWNGIKNAALGAAATLGSLTVNALGGWDAALQTLLVMMTADWVTGVVLAAVFKRSDKSAGGSLDSTAGFRGLCKKGAELVLVLLAVRLDTLMGSGNYARMAVLIFFIGNEGLSVLENLGRMGVPLPTFLKNALETLRESGDRGEQVGG